MKRSLVFQFIILVAVFSLGTVGCRKGPKSPTPIPGKSALAPGGGDAAPALPDGGGINTDGGVTSGPGGPGSGRLGNGGAGTGTGMGSTTLPDLPPLGSTTEDREFFRANTVYFDYDRSEIRGSERSKINDVATYLKDHPAENMLIEGHCDERGTEGYNLSLGERRALAVREYLMNSGVSGDRVRTLSWGEDRPVDLGHNEAAWAKNRRAEFVIVRGK